MKAEQSSLYRQLEVLDLWGLDTFENAPKQPMVQANVKLFAENVVQAMTAVSTALNTANAQQRFDLLDVVVMNMTAIKSITKILTEYSPSSGRGSHIISKPQRVRLLEIMTRIGTELGRWRNSTLSEINKATSLPN